MSTVRSKIKKKRSRNVKALCVALNVLLALIGTAAIVVGLWIWFTVYNDPSGNKVLVFVDDTFWITNFLFVGIGAFIVIMTFIGFFGLFREHKCSVLVYFFLLLLIFITAIAFTTMAFVFFFQLKRDLSLELTSGVLQYYGTNGKDDVTEALDTIQIRFDCCGESSYSEWIRSEWYENEKMRYFTDDERKPYPRSCCTVHPDVSRTSSDTGTVPRLWNATACYSNATSKYINGRGCFDVVYEWIYPYVLLFGGAGAFLLLMLLADLLGYIFLLRKVDFDDDEAEEYGDRGSSRHVDRQLPPLDDDYADNINMEHMRKSAVPAIDFTMARKW
ncbi:tetraspanin-18B-like [Ptychodera flava]|uniref:tetraspanin-18B-like n=1 Tax=Ptychodera flava TaxID=63121 RepID=UPI00396A1D8F